MINLLPPEEKETLLLEKRKKLVTILGIVIITSLVCFILILFSLRLYIVGEISTQSIFSDNIEKVYQTPDFLLSKEVMQKYNTTLVNVDNFYKNETTLYTTLKIILEVERPKGLSFTGIVIDRVSEGNIMKITINGISNNRDDLLAFKDSLEKNKNIGNLYFPPENWIKPEHIAFYLTFNAHK